MFAWIRKGNGARAMLVVVNFSPNVYRDYRVRAAGRQMAQVLNSDSAYGGNVGNIGEVHAQDGAVTGC